MMSWGFWILFAVGLCALAGCGMWIENQLARLRRTRQTRQRLNDAWPAKPPATAREKQAARKLKRAR